MKIAIQKYKEVYILQLEGDFDLYSVGDIKTTINKLLEKNILKFIINMEKVTYLDSSGVGVLISIFKSAQAGSFNFFLINMDGSVKNVIELTKLNNYFPIAKNIEEAVLKLINL